MAFADLMPYLPLIGATAGAIIGAFAAGLIKVLQDWRARVRERRGLLLLIDAEIYSHIVALKQLKAKSPKQLKAASLRDMTTPRTENWDGSKERLAQLLPMDHMRDLVNHYKVLKDVTASTSAEETKGFRARALADLADPIIAQGQAIREKGKQYLKELPDYDEPAFDDPSDDS